MSRSRRTSRWCPCGTSANVARDSRPRQSPAIGGRAARRRSRQTHLRHRRHRRSSVRDRRGARAQVRAAYRRPAPGAGARVADHPGDRDRRRHLRVATPRRSLPGRATPSTGRSRGNAHMKRSARESQSERDGALSPRGGRVAPASATAFPLSVPWCEANPNGCYEQSGLRLEWRSNEPRSCGPPSLTSTPYRSLERLRSGSSQPHYCHRGRPGPPPPPPPPPPPLQRFGPHSWTP